MYDTLKYSHRVAVSATELNELLQFACSTIVTAGNETLPYFRASLALENKDRDGNFDPVTEADRACERSLRTAIKTSYPEHGLLGEEFGFESGNGLSWVMDPIDGTRAFVSGLLHWGVLLALFDGSAPLLGAMYQPYTDELFFAGNQDAYLKRGSESKRLSTRRCKELSNATLATTDPRLFNDGFEQIAFRAVEDAVRLSRYGGDCYQYTMLASGQIDVVIENEIEPWDIQALIPIIRTAGGNVTTWDGENAALGGRIVATGDPFLHEELLKLLQ